MPFMKAKPSVAKSKKPQKTAKVEEPNPPKQKRSPEDFLKIPASPEDFCNKFGKLPDITKRDIFAYQEAQYKYHIAKAHFEMMHGYLTLKGYMSGPTPQDIRHKVQIDEDGRLVISKRECGTCLTRDVERTRN
jgi:hypothetical protein